MEYNQSIGFKYYFNKLCYLQVDQNIPTPEANLIVHIF